MDRYYLGSGVIKRVLQSTLLNSESKQRNLHSLDHSLIESLRDCSLRSPYHLLVISCQEKVDTKILQTLQRYL